MASIPVHSLQFSVELQMAGFTIYMDDNIYPKMRATISCIPHRKLRSLANKVWKKTLKEYGSFNLVYRTHTGESVERRMPSFVHIKFI